MRTTFLAPFVVILIGSGWVAAQQPMAPPQVISPVPAPAPTPAPAPVSLPPNTLIPPISSAMCDSGCGEPVILKGCSTNCADLGHFKSELLMWWIKKGPETAPLLTTTTQNPPNILTYGGLADASTIVLFGQTNMDYGTILGGRFEAGFALNDRIELEARGFFLAQKTFHFGVLGDANGNPPLFEPMINMRPNISTDPNNPDFGSTIAGFPTSFPGVFGNGIFTVDSTTSLWGAEINSVIHLNTDSPWRLSLVAGVRTLVLDENFDIHEGTSNVTSDPDFGFIYLGSVFFNQGSRHDEVDTFKTFNNFYGGQIGLNVERQWGRLSMNAGFTVALGGTEEKLAITGATRVIPLGLDITPPGSLSGTGGTIIPFVPVSNFGGVLTDNAVIGNHYRAAISTASEFNFQLGYDVTTYFRLTVGYTFLYLGNVARPGEQIDSLVNQSLLPSGVHFDNTFAGQPYPRLLFPQSDFWAQGVSFGAEFRF